LIASSCAGRGRGTSSSDGVSASMMLAWSMARSVVISRAVAARGRPRAPV
jgi:hypothetical protein